MASSLKKILKQSSPKLFKKLKGYRREWHSRQENGGIDFRIKKSFVARHGKKVVSGPFKGLLYGDDAVCSAYVAKLVGSYEEELHWVIEEVIQQQPSLIIDIGCAEGYYAVGMAKRLPSTTVYAFDTDVEAQEHCLHLAKLNSVLEHFHVKGLCDHGVMSKLTQTPALIICDCEGCELEILDPQAVPTLAHCDILVEFHEYFVPGVTQRVKERFTATHSITLIDTADRDPSRYPSLSHMPVEDQERALQEGRGPMQWGFFKALN